MRTILLLIPGLILVGAGGVFVVRRSPSPQVAILTLAGIATAVTGLTRHRPAVLALGLVAIAAAELLRRRAVADLDRGRGAPVG